ncbi:GNAT family N-acetyltransferase [Nitrincola alkalilacustris]|uniref:GNAT family N-acetyltransferase n=1 Tax=Nitrincola alkalilacustris TaxID=1571224 RepID=UPI0019808BE8|nr:GNAT family N-acetyltransferase [Nitrincola alkalilacustris]
MITIRRITTTEPDTLMQLSELLIDAIEGGASVGFLSPVSRSSIELYWQGVLSALDKGLVLLLAEEEGRIVGSVQLDPCQKENGRHRAEVQKLFVLRSHRGRGISSLLMQATEEQATALGRTLLHLDTLAGSPAESIYQHLGWQRVGEIPDYAAEPGGVLFPTVIFYKKLPMFSE